MHGGMFAIVRLGETMALPGEWTEAKIRPKLGFETEQHTIFHAEFTALRWS